MSDLPSYFKKEWEMSLQLIDAFTTNMRKSKERIKNWSSEEKKTIWTKKELEAYANRQYKLANDKIQATINLLQWATHRDIISKEEKEERLKIVNNLKSDLEFALKE